MTRITFEGRRYPLQPEESALDAMLRGGAKIAFSCRKGSCHSCLLQAIEGVPGDSAQRSLTSEMRRNGYFLPCVAVPKEDLTVRQPDYTSLYSRAVVSERTSVTPDITRLTLDPEPSMRWRAGQYINIRHPEGFVRSYSIASVQAEDVFATLYVRRVPGGVVSRWLCDDVIVGSEVEIQGPLGACHYNIGADGRPMLLLATGSGFAAMFGVVREALAAGHRAPIHLYHGVRVPGDLILQEEVRRLVAAHPTLTYHACVSSGRDVLPVDALRGRVTEFAFRFPPEMKGWLVYACGLPAMVYDARTHAIRAGVHRDDIYVDPFISSAPYQPDDARKLNNIAPDPELWRALRDGEGLTEILTQFYGQVFNDPRLAPFFHRISKQRAIEKQYEFLRGVFTGAPGYLGLNPFNAHHWMVISDELFDYRERMLEAWMIHYGLSEHLRWRWAAVHEAFRAEIVKQSPRGMFVRGEEHNAEGYTSEVVVVATVCDGCCNEMSVGAIGRMHARTGELFCSACDARRVGATGRPGAVASQHPSVAEGAGIAQEARTSDQPVVIGDSSVSRRGST